MATCKRVVKRFSDGFRVVLYIPDNARPGNVTRLADLVHRSYVHFRRRFGRAPWKTYQVLAFKWGYAGLFNAMAAPLRLFTKPIVLNEILFPLRSVIHEVSHTWWGNLLVTDTTRNYWIIEGFAKLSEITALKALLGPSGGMDVEQESFARLKMVVAAVLDWAPSPSRAGAEKTRSLQVAGSYYRGAMFLRLLRQLLGARRFDRGLRDFVAASRSRYVSTADLRKAPQPHSPMDLSGLFRDELPRPVTVVY